MSDLQQRLLDAHRRDDRAALVALYTEAADTANDVDAACFFLTHAYIFGLELDHPQVPVLFDRLRAEGRV